MTKDEAQELREEIASQLSRKMGEAQISPPALAKRTRMTDVTIRNYMQAKRDPKLIDFIAIAEALGCAVTDLLPQSVLSGTSFAVPKVAKDLATSTKSLRLSTTRDISNDEAEAVRLRLEILEDEDALIDRQARQLEEKRQALQELEARIQRSRTNSSPAEAG